LKKEERGTYRERTRECSKGSWIQFDLIIRAKFFSRHTLARCQRSGFNTLQCNSLRFGLYSFGENGENGEIRNFAGYFRRDRDHRDVEFAFAVPSIN
jgi:hypothetical protein